MITHDTKNASSRVAVLLSSVAKGDNVDLRHDAQEASTILSTMLGYKVVQMDLPPPTRQPARRFPPSRVRQWGVSQDGGAGNDADTLEQQHESEVQLDKALETLRSVCRNASEGDVVVAVVAAPMGVLQEGTLPVVKAGPGVSIESILSCVTPCRASCCFVAFACVRADCAEDIVTHLPYLLGTVVVASTRGSLALDIVEAMTGSAGAEDRESVSVGNVVDYLLHRYAGSNDGSRTVWASSVGESLGRVVLADLVGSQSIGHPVHHPHASPTPMRHRALLVGINHYFNFPELTFCNNDVHALARTLRLLGYSDVAQLHDGGTLPLMSSSLPIVSLIDVRNALDQFCNEATPDDVLFVYFSCHGIRWNGERCLIMGDTELGLANFESVLLAQTPTMRNALPLSEVESTLKGSRARRVVLVLDCCQGGVEQRTAEGVWRRAVEQDDDYLFNVYELGEGFAVLSASTASQTSYAPNELRHGIFTFYLLCGLQGEAARDSVIITVRDVYEYILHKMRRWGRKVGRSQIPTLRSEFIGDIVVARRVLSSRRLKWSLAVTESEPFTLDIVRKVELWLSSLLAEGSVVDPRLELRDVDACYNVKMKGSSEKISHTEQCLVKLASDTGGRVYPNKTEANTWSFVLNGLLDGSLLLRELRENCVSCSFEAEHQPEQVLLYIESSVGAFCYIKDMFRGGHMTGLPHGGVVIRISMLDTETLALPPATTPKHKRIPSQQWPSPDEVLEVPPPLRREPERRTSPRTPHRTLYKRRVALCIGIGAYAQFLPLSHASGDAEAVAQILREQHAFECFVLRDKDATRENIRSMFIDEIAPHVEEDALFLFFFAGHGLTEVSASGAQKGYIVPVDARAGKLSDVISMDELRAVTDYLKSRHILYVFDSCFGGACTALRGDNVISMLRADNDDAGKGQRRMGGGVNERETVLPIQRHAHRWVEQLLLRTARIVITAGGADQRVCDGGWGKHSVFSGLLLLGLMGHADVDGDGFFTSMDLFTFLTSRVTLTAPHQTPAFGVLPGHMDGDVLFTAPNYIPPKISSHPEPQTQHNSVGRVSVSPLPRRRTDEVVEKDDSRRLLDHSPDGFPGLGEMRRTVFEVTAPSSPFGTSDSSGSGGSNSVSAVHDVVSLANTIKAEMEGVQTKRQWCELLAQRINLVVREVRSLPAYRRSSDLLQRLVTCLLSAQDVIHGLVDAQQVSSALGCPDSRQFDEVDRRLVGCLEELGVHSSGGIPDSNSSCGSQGGADPTSVSSLVCSLSNLSATISAFTGSSTCEWLLSYDDLDFGRKRRCIGKGSFGNVYLATWHGLVVAVKEIYDEALTEDGIASFCREADLLHRLRHPNIVMLFGGCLQESLDEESDVREIQACLVMEYLPCGSLHDALHKHKKRFSDREVIRMAVEIARAMLYLHSSRSPILHRDLKPSNILLDRDGHTKIIDFGMARLKTASTIRSTVGSPQYMAPEVGREGYSEAVDVYSFGIILNEMCTGEVPFSSRTTHQILLDVQQGLRPRLASDRPAALNELVKACWDADSRKRPNFARVVELLLDLNDEPPERPRPGTLPPLPISCEKTGSRVPPLRVVSRTKKPSHMPSTVIPASPTAQSRSTADMNTIAAGGSPQPSIPVSQESSILESDSSPSDTTAAMLQRRSSCMTTYGGAPTPPIPQHGLSFSVPATYQSSVNARARDLLDKGRRLFLGKDGVSQDYKAAAECFYEASHLNNPAAQNLYGVCLRDGLGVEQDDVQAVRWFRLAADLGYPKAEVNLATMYFHGRGQSKDPARACEWYRRAADEGDPDGIYGLAVCLDEGAGVDKDPTQAADLYKRAAEMGHARGQYGLGVCFEYGRGVPQDFNQSCLWYRQSAEQGERLAQWSLGISYLHGRGVEKSETEALQWFHKSASSGYEPAMYFLGLCYEHGWGALRNYNLAASYYRQGADAGHSDSQVNLGLLYESGSGVGHDWESAFRWYEMAANKGHARGFFHLGLCYQNGRGCRIDDERAAECYRAASLQGHIRAAYSFGWCLEFGYGLQPNYKGAVTWYAKAADAGDPDGQFQLAECYATSKGLTKDYVKAKEYYRKAAEQNHARAQVNLGWLLEHGYGGCEPNASEAVDWYLRAATFGNARGQYMLGWCYEIGHGVAQDETQAIGWYQAAADQGHRDAKNNLYRLLMSQTR